MFTISQVDQTWVFWGREGGTHLLCMVKHLLQEAIGDEEPPGYIFSLVFYMCTYLIYMCMTELET